ncbi:poly-beta-1,6-N-acetyl-D-glucosamine biosynthesis protein PgaD [Clostridium chromiireducens]|uniref:Poly-beta-1,6-N-acetyl-D-glucosamine biosynthesis protein PgaD n=1 Tax=Clostridium chromiireducens TaxID=225345 RepID=A0A964W486_9CLOT|nr:poly-beta-1,6-N-acetyl-D-glucosamine biosynthesis protein PgaD [Clostridium chromiireducens]MVX66022.1 poly-beta-1,6-N-acetyl-D-glucosamine biosynthesis protein PgaD [Clostridium chromiireducens]
MAHDDLDENIIDGKQKKKFKIIEWFFSVFGWSLMLGYLIQIIVSLVVWGFSLTNFYDKLFMIGNLENTIRIILATILISLILFIVMYGWGKYNFIRFAHLRRRKFPEDIKPEELAKYFNLSVEEIEKMQNDKKIELEKTII